MNYHHLPVMKNEIIEYLNCSGGKVYVDCTLGGCGHSSLILEHTAPDGILIAIDQDDHALDNAKKILKKYENRVFITKGNFSEIDQLISSNGFEKADGIIADLGVSSHHLDTAERGFSFQKDGPLDMRMNQDLELSAEDVVNSYEKEDLIRILRTFGEERFAAPIANRIIREREEKKISSTSKLAEIVKSAIPSKFTRKSKIHPATKTFMALRIEVNQELEVLERFLKKAPFMLNDKGRLCIITFHSLEDRMVKHAFRELSKDCICPPKLPVCTCGRKKEFKEVTRKPVISGEDETKSNPRARSAKLRVLEKTGEKNK